MLPGRSVVFVIKQWRAYARPLVWSLILILGMSAPSLLGADQGRSSLKIDFMNGGHPEDLSVVIQLVFLMTLFSLAPSLVIMTTSFTRIVIVLSFVRNALGVQHAPANQILIGIALFLTFFLMNPIWDRIYSDAVKPYNNREITSIVAMERASDQLKGFMLKQTRSSDVEFFLELSNDADSNLGEIPMRVALPAFVLSELRTAFEMGFLVFLPFLVIDFLVASTLMSMGMMMMPPALIALPFKLLLFVLVDGWYLVVKSLVESYHLA